MFLNKKPDFLIIGTQKGGTTSLFYYLSQHPGIFAPYKKEIHYYDLNFSKGEAWYRKHFPLIFSNKISGEASPYYMFHPKVPERVAKQNPNVKIIILLRNPIQRAHSHYQMAVRKGNELHATFEEAILNEKKRIEEETKKIFDPRYQKSDFHQQNSYISRGKYYDQLIEWQKHFKKDQILIMKSESFFENPQKEVSEVFHFLGLGPFQLFDLKNQLKGNYNEIKKETKKELELYFKPYNEKLYKLIEQDFNW